VQTQQRHVYTLHIMHEVSDCSMCSEYHGCETLTLSQWFEGEGWALGDGVEGGG
jgi:hypothetical protein